jgi:hypothetical protein
MRKLFILFNLISYIVLISQTDQVRYRRCISGCTEQEINDPRDADFNYGLITDWEQFEARDVVSDYSMRICPGCTIWHKGVDYSSFTWGNGNADRGDAILATESGTISLIRQGNANFIYVIINGTHDYGYGHLFRSEFITTTNYLKSGKFIIKRCDNLNNLAIIDLEQCIAYSDVNGARVTIPGLLKCPNNQTVFTTTNQINAGDELGPIGDSGGNFEPHLHLYNMKGDFIDPNNENHTASAFENVIHSAPDFNLTFRTLNNNNGITITYPGTNDQPIKLRTTMANAVLVNGSARFTNVSLNVDEVKIEIKKNNFLNYNTIECDQYESRINLGATDASIIYPTIVTQRYGDWDLIGQYPYAYTDNANQPYDEFYFTGFLTRIHSLDKMNGTTLISNCPGNSRYNDGIYNIRAKLKNTRGTLTNSQAQTVILDNFKPFVEHVLVDVAGSQNTKLIMDEGWECGSSNTDQCLNFVQRKLKEEVTCEKSKKGYMY